MCTIAIVFTIDSLDVGFCRAPFCHCMAALPGFVGLQYNTRAALVGSLVSVLCKNTYLREFRYGMCNLIIFLILENITLLYL